MRTAARRPAVQARYPLIFLGFPTSSRPVPPYPAFLSYLVCPHWRPEDAPSIARHADDPQVAANLRDVFPCPYQLSDAEEFIRLCRAAEPEQAIFRAIVVDGQAVGSVALTRGTDVCRRSAELGYWLGRALWGRGIMTKAVEEMCRTGFEAWDIVRIYAEPFAHNAGSRRVLEKAGFALEGVMRCGIWKNGRLRDYCMYALLRPETP